MNVISADELAFAPCPHCDRLLGYRSKTKTLHHQYPSCAWFLSGRAMQELGAVPRYGDWLVAVHEGETKS